MVAGPLADTNVHLVCCMCSELLQQSVCLHTDVQQQLSAQIMIMTSLDAAAYLHACRVLLCLQALDEALVAATDGHHLTGRANLVYQGLYIFLNSPHALTTACQSIATKSRNLSILKHGFA